jgi:2-polyprenyl-6-methoxyphenol hydroxylase-like FAD-dependent oxidoreductase
MRVGIIGAGIGGSCLAHGLKSEGVNVSVFERNPAATSGLAGYGIHINVFGQEAMKECLPGENWQAFLKASRPIGGQARFYDEDLHLLAAQEGVHVKNGAVVEERRLSISRTELKDILLEGLSDVVQWDRTFVRYETLPDDRIRIHFADQRYSDVDVLVGADGANSKVRKQYLPQIERLDVGVTIIVGRSRLTPELASSLPPDLIDGSPNSIVPLNDDWMFTSVWRAPVNTNADSKTAQIDTFAVWAYIAASNKFPPNLSTFAPEALCGLALSRTAGWNDNLHRLMKQSDMPSVSVVPLKSMPLLPTWESSTVTLLGDSIHNMTPMAGIGANTALRDARLLKQGLGFAEVCESDPIHEIKEYEVQMRRYANEALRLSLRNSRNAVDPSMFKRRMFRGALKIAQALPPVKRLLFPPGR